MDALWVSRWSKHRGLYVIQAKAVIIASGGFFC